MRSDFQPVPTAALLSLGRRGAPQTRREQGLPGRDLLLQLSPLASSVHLLQSFWGRRAWGLRGREACCGLLLWPVLPRSVSPGRKGDSQALMEGGCLPWLFIFGEAHCLSPLLVVLGWPDVARGSPVGSQGSWPSPNSLLSPD